MRGSTLIVSSQSALFQAISAQACWGQGHQDRKPFDVARGLRSSSAMVSRDGGPSFLRTCRSHLRPHASIRLAAVTAWVLAPVVLGMRTLTPIFGDATPDTHARPSAQVVGAGASLETCTLDGINADLRVAWWAVSKAGKQIRDGHDIKPFGLEIGAACARHYFLALDELGDKLVKTTVAKRLRASSSKFA